MDKKIAQRIGLMTVFNPQTLFVSVCSRSGNVFTDIYCRGSVKDERDATRTSRMGLGTIRTLTDQLRMTHERATATKVRMVRTV